MYVFNPFFFFFLYFWF